ncbi:MAG TPA: hypothetical protein VF131_00350 [Blastocatellia bacterium]|nr:hypothetical protein [Blastocatellia bacterium]
MKTTIQRLTTEIEYLEALAVLYEGNHNGEVLRATRAAIESLKALVETINGRKERPCKLAA